MSVGFKSQMRYHVPSCQNLSANHVDDSPLFPIEAIHRLHQNHPCTHYNKLRHEQVVFCIGELRIDVLRLCLCLCLRFQIFLLLFKGVIRCLGTRQICVLIAFSCCRATFSRTLTATASLRSIRLDTDIGVRCPSRSPSCSRSWSGAALTSPPTSKLTLSTRVGSRWTSGDAFDTLGDESSSTGEFDIEERQ